MSDNQVEIGMVHRFLRVLGFEPDFQEFRRDSRASTTGGASGSSTRSSSSFVVKGNNNYSGAHTPQQLQLEPEVCALLLEEHAKNVAPIVGKKVGPPPVKAGVSYVNITEEDQMEISGYHPSHVLSLLTWLAIVLTCGLLRLVFHWRPSWMLTCTHRKCTLEKASTIQLVDQYGQLFVEKVEKIIAGNESNETKFLNKSSEVKNPTAVVNSTNGHTNLDLSEKSPSPPYLIRPGPQGEYLPTNCLIYFENKRIRYLWDPEAKEFSKVRGLDKNLPFAYFQYQTGLSEEEQSRRQILYRKNSIIVEVQSIFNILFQEVLEPFYVFQVFSLCVWFSENYVYYASCIIVMSAMSLTTSVYQIRKNQKSLKNTVHGSDVVTVYRNKHDHEDIPSDQIVPGDIIMIPRHGCVMQCDALLINGNCIVNESMLTGESVPVTKTSIHGVNNGKIFHPKEDGRHMLFCGTKVIQTRYYDNESVKAVVVRTGFLTAKGELVRSIMFPKPVDFKFNRHINKFILCLASLAAVGFVFTIVFMLKAGAQPSQFILRALDLITIVIPPALPAAMTIGIVFAQSRLKKHQIYCISPRSINISGCINCVCFDKTGTLTEDGLDLWGVVPVQEKRFTLANRSPAQLGQCPFLVGMATCHSLTIIDHQLTGDPLDLKMFDSTEWVLEEPEIDDTAKYDIITPTIVRPKNSVPVKLSATDLDQLPYEVGIVRQFPFSSSLQRMCVITRTLGAQHFDLYCKGAPETVVGLCSQESIPEDFSETLMSYTQQGYRVIALAFRPLPRLSYTKAQRIAREELEIDLTLLGLLVMENRLKEESTPVLDTLKMADIRTVMVTGDNMLTALSVARDCHMVELHHQVVLLSVNQENTYLGPPQLVWHFSDVNSRKDALDGLQRTSVNVILEKPDKVHVAVTGKTFAVLRDHYPELLKKVAVSGTVFARMAPEQKQQLVELLQELGYFVGMCGDGANDCGALKAAHAGISLSETEASVASPFTSKTPNISCVPTLIKEGRAALVTSFGVLKYMACYSLAQFISVIILYTRHSNLTDMEFLYIDLFLITIFIALFGRTSAFESLAKRPPPSSLMGVAPLSSVALQVVLIFGFQMAAIVLLWQQSWYKAHSSVFADSTLKCHDNYVIFAVSVFQYIVQGIIFSSGVPYRKPLYTNKLFLGVLIIMSGFTIYLVIAPDPWLANRFEMELDGVTMAFRVTIFAIAIGHFLLSVFVENFLVNHVLYRKCQSRQSNTEYQLLEKSTCGPPTWLPTYPLTPMESEVGSPTSLVPLVNGIKGGEAMTTHSHNNVAFNFELNTNTANNQLTQRQQQTEKKIQLPENIQQQNGGATIFTHL